MNELIKANSELPSTIQELSRFALIGREKLVAVRAEIRAINKIGLAQEVREQKLHEAQDIADAVLDAEVRIGELMRDVQKQSGGNHGNQYTSGKIDSGVDFGNEQHEESQFTLPPVKTKADVVRESGFTQKQVERFQKLADNPELVEQAKAEARENDDIVSRSSVLSLIKQANDKPHVSNNSGNNEWYTPKYYIDLVRDVLGEIDVDPASCEYANRTVQAKRFYSIDDDGLQQVWSGKVFMNPPYAADLVQKFTEQFVNCWQNGFIDEGIVLVNNATETSWFIGMVEYASAVSFPKGRIRYESPTKETNAPLQGQAFLYFGNNPDKFMSAFSEIGWCATVRKGA